MNELLKILSPLVSSFTVLNINSILGIDNTIIISGIIPVHFIRSTVEFLSQDLAFVPCFNNRVYHLFIQRNDALWPTSNR